MTEFAGLDAESFRAEVQAWLGANFPPSLAFAQPVVLPAGAPVEGDLLLWKERLVSMGWSAPGWPVVYGGGGLSAAQVRVLQQEMARIGAENPMAGIGLMMLGPTLLEFGTEVQKRRHLPAIARGETRWCQGYSEPGAGSDLASLQMRCEDAGDHWKLNGQKVWTSGADHSDWCFCLVRTDTTRKQGGISFVLVDMRQPGIETRPIRLISGASPFCETFFTDARAEKDDLVGEINGGWAIGKKLLLHERSGQGGARMMPGPSVVDLAKRYVGLDAEGRVADPDLRSRLARHMIDTAAHMLTVQRAAAESKTGSGPSAATSIMKNSGSWLGQEKAELTLEIMGSQGLGWAGDEFAADEIQAVRTWLHGKSMTIFGGSQEILSNIVAKRILELPELTQAA